MLSKLILAIFGIGVAYCVGIWLTTFTSVEVAMLVAIVAGRIMYILTSVFEVATEK
jgi:hypothetical protein